MMHKTQIALAAFAAFGFASCSKAEVNYSCDNKNGEGSALIVTRDDRHRLAITAVNGTSIHTSDGVRSIAELTVTARDFCTAGESPSITAETMAQDGSEYTCTGYKGDRATVVETPHGTELEIENYRAFTRPNMNFSQARTRAEKVCWGIPVEYAIQ